MLQFQLHRGLQRQSLHRLLLLNRKLKKAIASSFTDLRGRATLQKVPAMMRWRYPTEKLTLNLSLRGDLDTLVDRTSQRMTNQSSSKISFRKPRDFRAMESECPLSKRKLERSTTPMALKTSSTPSLAAEWPVFLPNQGHPAISRDHAT